MCSIKGKIATTYILSHEQNRQYLFNMSYLEAFGVQTGVSVDVLNFSESEQEQEFQSVEQEWSRSLKNVTPFISDAYQHARKFGYFLYTVIYISSFYYSLVG